MTKQKVTRREISGIDSTVALYEGCEWTRINVHCRRDDKAPRRRPPRSDEEFCRPDGALTTLTCLESSSMHFSTRLFQHYLSTFLTTVLRSYRLLNRVDNHSESLSGLSVFTYTRVPSASPSKQFPSCFKYPFTARLQPWPALNT